MENVVTPGLSFRCDELQSSSVLTIFIICLLYRPALEQQSVSLQVHYMQMRNTCRRTFQHWPSNGLRRLSLYQICFSHSDGHSWQPMSSYTRRALQLVNFSVGLSQLLQLNCWVKPKGVFVEQTSWSTEMSQSVPTNLVQGSRQHSCARVTVWKSGQNCLRD